MRRRGAGAEPQDPVFPQTAKAISKKAERSIKAVRKEAERQINAAREEAERQISATTEGAKRQINAAREQTIEAERKARNARDRLEEDNAAKSLLEKEEQARRGLRYFVQESLSDILAGVDDAAIDARHRQLNDGLTDSGFITPGRIGPAAVQRRESTVEFDVAVVAGKQVKDQEKEGESQDIKGKISLMEVIPLGFSAEVSSGVHHERRSEERSDVRRHNRVRFSVPVTFASLDEPSE